jgi:peptide/nickel transport system substrate-binding protein
MACPYGCVPSIILERKETFMKRSTPKILFLALCALCVSSCQKGASTPNSLPSKDYSLDQLDSIGKAYVPQIGTYGGEAHLPLDADPDGFCPALASSGYSMTVLAYIFEGLVTSDPVTLDYKPAIAKSWEVSPDGLAWTFHMRDDVFFSDGVKCSAHDVVFTFNDVIYNEKLHSSLNYNFRINDRKIDVSAPDSFTVIFRLPFPFAPFLTVAGMDILPRHLYAKNAADGTLESFLSNGAKPESVVGTGPFMLSKVDLGQRIVLKKNPRYWKKDSAGNRLPYLDQVVLLIIKEPNVQMLKFKAGEIDHLLLMGEHYPILKPLENEGGFSLYKVGPRWYDGFFEFNENNQKNPKTGKYYLEEKKQKWFRNKNFRKACAYAVNYREIINIVYNGLAYPPGGVWGKHKGYFHNPKAITYTYDTEKAKELLAQEGFKDRNGDGFLEDADGNTAEFTITTTAGVKLITDVFGIVRKDLEKIGLKAHLNFIEFNNVLDKIQNTYDWDVVAMSLGGIRDPHFGKSSEIYSSFRYTINPNQKKPSSPWEARVAEIFDLAVSEMDKTKRKALYDEWQEIVMDQCTKVYLPIREVVLGASNKFGNIHLTRYLGNIEDLLYNIDEIYVKQPQAAK